MNLVPFTRTTTKDDDDNPNNDSNYDSDYNGNDDSEHTRKVVALAQKSRGSD